MLGSKYELLKIILHSTIAYKIAKYIIRKLKLEDKYKSVNPLKIFVLIFLLCNSYIIIQYLSRMISHQLINRELRQDLNNRTLLIGPAGWGYECDSLDYKEFRELTKFSRIIKIPKESNLIFVHDWSEFDFRRTVEFEVPLNFKIHDFYKNNSLTLNNLSEIEYGSFVSRTTFSEYGRIRDFKKIKFDTTRFKRFKYELSDN